MPLFLREDFIQFVWSYFYFAKIFFISFSDVLTGLSGGGINVVIMGECVCISRMALGLRAFFMGNLQVDNPIFNQELRHFFVALFCFNFCYERKET